MKVKTAKLDELCTIKTGSPVSRAKNIPEGVEAKETKVLLPRAMQGGNIVDSELAIELVGEVKEEYFTCRDDVVIKLSTPFDCVYVDEDHEGIMVTSFGMILRKRDDAPIDMQYLSMFLNAPQTNALLAAVSTGQTTTMAMLKRKTVADLEIPLLPVEKQGLLAKLSEAVGERIEERKRLIDLDKELLNSELTNAIWGEEQ